LIGYGLRIEKVLLIGAGQIAAFADTPTSTHTLSHAHAIVENPDLSLAGFIDPNLKKAQEAVQQWGGQAFRNLLEAITLTQPAVIVIATPDESHYPLLKQIVGLKKIIESLKLVIVEKPITLHSSEAQEIIELYAKHDLPLLVNYSRRFLPALQQVRQQILSADFGPLLAGNAYYGKGLLHIGSHMLDCVQFLTGDIQSAFGMSAITDFNSDDPSISGFIRLASGAQISLHAIDCQAYTHFELDMLFERKRIRLLDFATQLEEAELQESLIFKGHRHLVTIGIQPTDLANSMTYLYTAVTKFLQDGHPFPITSQEACKTIAICERLRDNLQTQKQSCLVSIG
jgi:predicted dehydrogenase